MASDFLLLGRDAHAGVTADYVVEFVFMVRLLRIPTSGGEDVKSGAQGWYMEKLAVELGASRAFCLDFCESAKRTPHAKIPPKTRSVNCGIRFCVCKSPSGLYH